MNRKGFAHQLLTLIIIFLVLALLMAGFFLFSLAAPIFTKTSTLIGNTLITATQNSSDQNLSNAVKVSANAATNSFNILPELSYVFIILLFFSFIGLAFYVRTYPFLIVFWILLVLVLGVLSIFLANAYHQATTSDQFLNAEYKSQAWGGSDFLMENLPVIIVSVGIVGGIIMFALATRSSEVDGGMI